MNIKQRNSLYNIATALGAVITFIVGYLGVLVITDRMESIGRHYGYGFICIAVISAVLTYFMFLKGKMCKLIIEIKGEWGKEIKKKRKLDQVSNIFKSIVEHRNKSSEEFYIDDQTWLDLNGDGIYKKLDRSYSFLGEIGMYFMLRYPLLDKKKILRRKNIIQWFEKNKEKREEIQFAFANIGKDKEYLLSSYIFKENKMEIHKNDQMAIAVCSKLFLLIVPIWFLVSGGAAVLFTVILFVVNMLLSLKLKNEVEGNAPIFSLMGKMIISGNKIVKQISGEREFEEGFSQLQNMLKKCDVIRKNSSLLVKSEVPGNELSDLLAEYFNIMTLNNYRKMAKGIKYINKYEEELIEIFMLLGEIEGLIAVGSYRKNISYCLPEFIEENKSNIDAVEIYHPLVENCVQNTINIAQGIIITGSNMSGKSTFLRTIGICQLFSQTIVTVPAKKFETGLMKIISSIDIHDDINNKKSYYFVEVENLFRIIEESSKGVPVLALVDEILNGTNPVDRIAAATGILKYLEKHMCIPIVATHDMELTGNLKDRYNCYYFTEKVEGNGMEFDYKINEGVSDSRNAIKLLKVVGYPQEILENII
ncbi:MutS-related protein [Oceanirhabdus seepicola]|uniref:DNA mismatch repair proteins mutS family domain-containing protein n=1 Tax=Oceanirhabdus seepicola TaxID=2828781 RepID=A0A9J6P1N2_9CLOT|nr:hypothetical protein [Oceanirhabdus seepicola]MCM1989789.1 hypothetical protein [Oceanirhabdus seepicola]